MINNYIQPKKIIVNDNLQLVKYYPYYKRSLEWYQDLTLCKQVDNIDFPYDITRLKNMYKSLSKNGECYYIKAKINGKFILIGDISLCNEEIGLAICKDYQNMHYGRKCVRALLERAKQLGIKKVKAEIYDFNKQSQKMFLAVGFVKVDKEHYCFNL